MDTLHLLITRLPDWKVMETLKGIQWILQSVGCFVVTDGD